MTRACVVGIGNELAGDDAVALTVIRTLRALGRELDVELHEVGDATALIPWLLSEAPLVIVDAVLETPAGRVRVLSEDELWMGEHAFASTHGFGVTEAIRLARALRTRIRTRPLQLVGVNIDSARPGHLGLSEAVAAAVPEAARVVLEALTRQQRAQSSGAGA